MKRLNLMIVGLLLLGSTETQAETIYVSGNVSGVWSADTVIVQGETTVPIGQVLTILPGVQVRVTGLFKLIIQGRLTARGNTQDSILFTRHYPTEESKWRGLRFDAADNASILEYCRVEWAKNEAAYPEVHGGGIWINHCSPTVRHCLIQNNYSHNANYNGMGAGICPDEASNSVIEYNLIKLNQADSGGGICVGSTSHPIIRYNTMESNQAFYAGGAIYVAANSEAEIYENVIQNNSSGGWGGGGINLWSATWLYGTTSNVYGNLIANNTATDAGGGIYSRYDGSFIYKNTLVNNQAARGGGLYVLTFSNLPPTVHSSILWNNTAPTGMQIYLDPAAGSAVNVTYCSVDGGWTGVGNIGDDPNFIDFFNQDYRLSWGSPCIDTGDPDYQYNDPDGTLADMGYAYFDQRHPVSVYLNPYNAPIQIPAGGGSFTFGVYLVNISSTSQHASFWCDVTLPNGAIYGPVLGPVTLTLSSGFGLSRARTQNVPASAPAGTYTYNAYAVALSDTSTDSFTFNKAGTDGGESGFEAWKIGGEAFVGEQCAAPLPEDFKVRIYPNPFNPTTVLSFELRVASYVKLEVFDINGRGVGAKHFPNASPASGSGATPTRYESGIHQIAFDGSGLPSGIYFAKLTAGDFSQTQKLVLLK